jgi:hypothetical protein
LVGSSVFSAVDMYQKLVPFILQWKQMNFLKKDTPYPLYIVSVDVEKAFDNIVQPKLYEIVQNVIAEVG